MFIKSYGKSRTLKFEVKIIKNIAEYHKGHGNSGHAVLMTVAGVSIDAL